MVTKPLCGEEWLKAHEIQKCIRCGQCCLRVPCIYGQMETAFTLKQGNICPSLKRNPDKTFTCILINHWPQMKREMLGTGCENTEWRDNPIPIFQDLVSPSTKEGKAPFSNPLRRRRNETNLG